MLSLAEYRVPQWYKLQFALKNKVSVSKKGSTEKGKLISYNIF